jgi:hypothetical protein
MGWNIVDRLTALLSHFGERRQLCLVCRLVVRVGTTDCLDNGHLDRTVVVHRFTQSEAVTEKQASDPRKFLRQIDTLSVHNPRFIRMQFQSTLSGDLGQFFADRLDPRYSEWPLMNVFRI